MYGELFPRLSSHFYADGETRPSPAIPQPMSGDEVHRCVVNGGLAEPGHDSCSSSLSSSPLPKSIDLNDLESEVLDLTSEPAGGGGNDTSLLHNQQDSVMEVSVCTSNTRGIQRNLSDAFSSCHPAAVTFSQSTQADSGVAASGYLGDSAHVVSKGFASQASEVDSAIGPAAFQERRRGFGGPPHPNKLSDSSGAPPNDSGVWGVRLKTSECPNGNLEDEMMQVSEIGLNSPPNCPTEPTPFTSCPQQLLSHPKNSKQIPISPVQSHISPMKSPLNWDMKPPQSTAPPLHSSHPPSLLSVQSETPKSRSSLRGSFTRYQRSLGAGGHGKKGSGSATVPSTTMIKDLMEKKERLKAKLQHGEIRIFICLHLQANTL